MSPRFDTVIIAGQISSQIIPIFIRFQKKRSPLFFLGCYEFERL